MDKDLVAPCGINCGICLAYLRETSKCPGCRAPNIGKPITRIRCKIKTCKVFKKGKAKFCFECDEFPCKNLGKLDKRYREKYHMSMVENLNFIENNGVRAFLKAQSEKYSCSCGGTVCVHNNKCYGCKKSAGN